MERLLGTVALPSNDASFISLINGEFFRGFPKTFEVWKCKQDGAANV